jgi:GNAT superfamily N-acetyltransferase
VLDDIVNWFRADGLEFSVEILPASCDDELMRALVKHGLYQSDFKNEYYRAPRRDMPAFSEGVTVRAFANDMLDEFADLVLEIDETPVETREATRRIRRAEFVNWRGYVAYVDGQAAAHCALYIRDGTGSFGFMDTNARFRGRGAQTALLNQRIADCAEAGCDLCLCQAVPGSVSARNIQRAGFHLAYTKAAWSCL